VPEPIGRYLGLDIIPEILDQAVATAADDPRFRFEISVECRIPESDGWADVVVGFSLITHLMDEEVFECIQEAHRVLRPGAVAIFSFMDFNLPVHQASFFTHASHHRQGHGDILKFTTQDVLTRFGTKAGFGDVSFIDGSADLQRSGLPSQLLDVNELPSTYQFGQSLCVLRKPESEKVSQRMIWHTDFIDRTPHRDRVEVGDSRQLVPTVQANADSSLERHPTALKHGA